MTRSQRKTGVKTWRLFYHRSGRWNSFTFLTVGEALEHARLLNVLRFDLEDAINPSLHLN